MNVREATLLAVGAIKDVWRSLGRGIEQEFVSDDTFKRRIADLNWAYKYSNKQRRRNKSIADFDRFMALVFFPFRGYEYDKYQQQIKRQKWNKVLVPPSPLDGTFVQKIIPCIISIPRFEETLHGNISEWFEYTNTRFHVDSAIEETEIDLSFDPTEDEEGVYLLLHSSLQSNVCNKSSQTDA